jgi:segregation and condensation protein A
VKAGLAVAAEGGSGIEFDLDLEVFDGPFDLLVTLILKDEVDLWEVRVSQIIAEYVLRLTDSGEFDLEATSQFVVMVAALLEMKSRLLLDVSDAQDEELLDPETAGEELLASLVRYAQFKAAANALRERWEVDAGRVYRTVAIPSRYLMHEALGRRLPSRALVEALTPLLREPPAPDVSHITDLAITLVRELGRLRDILARHGSFSFSRVAPHNRIERAITFFALLELHSRGEVSLHQSRAFGEITVSQAERVAGLAG